jgi:hypothetical protein
MSWSRIIAESNSELVWRSPMHVMIVGEVLVMRRTLGWIVGYPEGIVSVKRSAFELSRWRGGCCSGGGVGGSWV